MLCASSCTVGYGDAGGSKLAHTFCTMVSIPAYLPRNQATRVLYSDIDGTIAHYITTSSEDNGRKLVGEGITLVQEADDGDFSGTFRCTLAEVRRGMNLSVFIHPCVCSCIVSVAVKVRGHLSKDREFTGPRPQDS